MIKILIIIIFLTLNIPLEAALQKFFSSLSLISIHYKNPYVAFCLKVSSNAVENDCIPAIIKGWTALSFAVISSQVDIVKASEVSTSILFVLFH